MHIFKIFPAATIAAFTMPALLMANPAPSGNVFGARDLSDIELRSLHELFDRQAINTTGLIGLLTSLSQSLSGIEQLLYPSGISNINELVTDLAVLLKAPTADQTKSLLGTVSNLLGSSEISQLISGRPAILSSVSGLLTPALVTNVTDILSGAHDLLTPTFVPETKGLIADVGPVRPHSSDFEDIVAEILQSWLMQSLKLFGFALCHNLGQLLLYIWARI